MASSFKFVHRLPKCVAPKTNIQTVAKLGVKDALSALTYHRTMTEQRSHNILVMDVTTIMIFTIHSSRRAFSSTLSLFGN
jgi:hypothetical protein